MAAVGDIRPAEHAARRMRMRDLILSHGVDLDRVWAAANIRCTYDMYAAEMPFGIRRALGYGLLQEEIDAIVDTDAGPANSRACLMRLANMYAWLVGSYRDEAELARWRDRFYEMPDLYYRSIVMLLRLEVQQAMAMQDRRVPGIEVRHGEPLLPRSRGAAPWEVELRHDELPRRSGTAPSFLPIPADALRPEWDAWEPVEVRAPLFPAKGGTAAAEAPAPVPSSEDADLAMAIQMSLLDLPAVRGPEDAEEEEERAAPVVHLEGVGWVVDDRRPPVWAEPANHKSGSQDPLYHAKDQDNNKVPRFCYPIRLLYCLPALIAH